MAGNIFGPPKETTLQCFRIHDILYLERLKVPEGYPVLKCHWALLLPILVILFPLSSKIQFEDCFYEAQIDNTQDTDSFTFWTDCSKAKFIFMNVLLATEIHILVFLFSHSNSDSCELSHSYFSRYSFWSYVWSHWKWSSTFSPLPSVLDQAS